MGTAGFTGKFMMATSQKTDCNAYTTNSQGCGVRSSNKVRLGGPSLSAFCNIANPHCCRLAEVVRSRLEQGWWRCCRSRV